MTLPKESNYQILIVDDSPEDRETYKRYLRKSHLLTCEFAEAETVAEGLDHCSRSAPSCILLDYMLPDGDGLGFLDQLATQYAPHEIPVVMLTAHGDEDVIVNALKGGAMDYLSKGRINADVLCRIVYNAIERGILIRQLHERELEKDRLIAELQETLAQVKRLSGLLPICSNCKKVRNDSGYWQQVEVYVRDHSEVDFSHSLCPECVSKYFPEYADVDFEDDEPQQQGEETG